MSKKMRLEFIRYRFSRFRKLTGILQISACVGMLLGERLPILFTLASAGLAFMMFIAMIVRVKIKDPITLRLPAFFYFILNSYLFFESLGRLE